MDVDEAGVASPTNEWMEAAQRAADTDGILENGPAKRQKVCNPCNTLTALHLQTLHKNAHKKRESLQKARVRVARKCEKKDGSYQSGWWSGVAGSMPMDSAALGSPERGGDVDPTDPIQYSILSRWVRSRHLPPLGEAL